MLIVSQANKIEAFKQKICKGHFPTNELAIQLN